MIQDVVEVGDAHDFLGHRDVVQLFGQETLDQGHPQTLEGALIQSAAAQQHVVIASDGRGDFGHGAAGIAHHGAKKAGPFFLDPLVQALVDLVVTKELGRQFKRRTTQQG